MATGPNKNGQGGRGRGQGGSRGGQGGSRGGQRGGSSDHGNRSFRGGHEGRGGGAGRGSGRITDEQKAQIVGKREKTIQIASEGTDDVIVASPAPEGAQHIASYILRKEDFTNFNGQRQIRSFVNSCLLNLSNHHSVDTSGLLSSLASIAGRARLTEIMTMPMYIDAADEKAVLSFQYVILPFIGILTREAVCQSTMTSESGIIYSTVYLHYKRFLEDGVLHCMDKVLDRGSLDDRSSGALRLLREDQTICRVSSLQCALLGIVRLIYQLIKRIQNARIEIADVVRKLHEQQLRCIEVTPDTDENRFINQILVREVTRLQQIVSDAKDTLIEPIDPNVCLDVPVNSKKGRGPNMVHIVHYYDPPGELSPKGPRHDNDAHEISEITLLPTQAEITCTRPPFLPSNGILDAPHFLPPGWRRQLDIHFRLYREDMMDSLRKGVMAFLVALERTTKDKEGNLLKQKELKKHLDDNVSLNVYGGVVFLGMDCKKQSGGSIEISFTQPAQIAGMPHKRRTEFWERSRRRLMQGALVCIARRVEKTEVEIGATTPPFDMVLGVITKRDVEALAKNDSAAHIHISLTDPKLYLMMLNSATQTKDQPQWFLVETMGGFFESYRPILKALQRCVPAALPFGKYLAPTKEEEEARSATGGEADPPFYARAPGFLFDLSVLHKGLRMELNVLDPNSMHRAEELLQLPSHDTNYKPLDSTQAKALVETLCREVAIISGPPGTGKTKIGVDLMRVLLHNRKAMNCGPILCICYTNHALDQFLEHLLDEGIKEIVRVGARSKSEKLEDYNLENLRMSRDRPFSVRQALRAANDESDLVAKEIERLEKALRSGYMDWIYVSPFLMCHNERHWEQFREKIRSHDQDEDGEDETGFQTQKKNNKDDGHPYVQWATGADIKRKVEYNRVALAHKNKEAVVSDNQFSALEVEEEDTNVDSDKGKGKSKGKGKNKVDDNNNVPRQQMPFLQLIPSGDRPLQLLDDDLWHMSLRERMRLIESWKPEVQSSMMQMMADRLVQIEKLAEIKNNAFDDIRRSILRETSVIGMTTNGAAKFQTLISAVAPKIIICEEAGEVLESHILATLSVSTQHLILIGDHLQLRPQIETYELSSDSRIGQNFNLDKSLFERLVTNPKNPLPMSHLTIQRRMRPEISSLIRNTLYPDLEDGERVRQYPPVGGMRANLYFMDHAHPEDSKDQFGMQSYANTFEVKMVEALAHYLIKNGYDQPGDIAVLTPYLGQLSKLRDCLKNSFMLVIDERDQEQLDKNDQDKEQDETLGNVNETVGIKKVALQNHLTLRTIDNYQGEEAKIVIISLVRSNAKENGASLGSSSIGFLKSPNRTNVLLSRAQHGMYLIGNASLMENAKNGLWPTIVDELRRFDRVGDGFPISCKNHPEIENFVNNADAFKIVAPNGGCTATCGRNMRCGHVCPLSCHPDDFEHVMVKCFQPCPRLQPICNHVCPKRCGEECGNCMEIVAPFVLPCGHVFERPTCWQARDPSKIVCKVKVTHKLPTCEHEHLMNCYKDPSSVSCDRPCDLPLECGHNCTRSCSDCQKSSSAKSGGKKKGDPPAAKIPRTNHGKCLTKCGKNHFCGHACSTACHQGSLCPPCTHKCEVTCAHSRCHELCDKACAACCEQCTWECEHKGKCNMPCGAPCDRLPCNKRCEKDLKCGHRCPSVCGEKCPPSKFCVECKDPETMADIVDVIMQQPLSEVDVDDDPILVPSCGHALTMSSLDGMMEIAQYYVSHTDKKTGDVTYVSLKELPGEQVPQVSCHLCRKPILGILRYGRRVRYAQLAQRTKKQEMEHGKGMKAAVQALAVAQVKVEDGRTVFLASLKKLTPEACPQPPSIETRTLGTMLHVGATYPTSNFQKITDVYKVPKDHETAWSTLLRPVIGPYGDFTGIHNKATNSPAKRLFDAAVSHLYRIKTSTFDPTKDPDNTSTASDLVQACIMECGLPRDGHGGDAYVDSLHERTNVLILVHSQAIIALNEVGISSGWYWIVEDLIRCIRGHVNKLQEAALKGQYKKKAAYARLLQMDVLYKETSWLGMKELPKEDPEKAERLKKTDELSTLFMKELKEIEDNCFKEVKEECLKRATELEVKMNKAIRIAKGLGIYEPLSHDEKVQLFRAMNQELRGSGHWYQCPNGHPYVIGECGMAMQESQCPECGAAVGGGSHRLRQDNARATEYEGLYNRR